MVRLLSRLLAVAFILGAAATAASAEDVSGPDRDALRGIVSSQIEAFRRDDGAAAYAYASPGIQGLFPSIDRFMAMVRGSYQPVYRPRAVTFGELADTAAGPVQKVFLTGPDGRNWVALYSFERQPDGTWRINGVRLVEDDGTTI